MMCLWYFIFLFELGCFLFVGLGADCIEFIAEKRQREGFMTNVMPIAADGCVKICEDLNACYAVNYFRLNATCQLLNRTMPESKLIKATKWFYKAVRSPPQVNRSPAQESIDNDPCYKTLCPWDEICIINTTTNSAECYPFCKTPPVIPGAINEQIEVEAGQNYTYRCLDGVFGKRDQNPTITCLWDGQWAATNFTCVCTTLPSISGTIKETAEVGVGQNYTYKCQDDLFKVVDQNSAVTCLQNGSWTLPRFICAKQNLMQDRMYPNKIYKSVEIRNETGIEIWECMQQCDDKMNSCVSFFYDKHTSHCVLSSSFRRGLPQGFQFSDGFVYYTVQSTSCDMDYINVTLAGSYFCIKVYSSGGTFVEAMKKCESERAKLLVITTNAQIADLARATGTNGIVWAFIGVTDEASEGQWLSWDGSAVNLNWKPGEPSNTVNQNCAFVSYSNYYVIDMSCNEYQPFICHKKWL